MPRPPIVQTLRQGLRRRCPRCGEGALFGRWFTLEKRCSSCHLDYERNPGDTWALWLIGDRLFIAVMIIIVFLLVRSDSWTFGIAITVATIVPLVWTMPHRMGFCLAVDYWVRASWGDLSETVRAGDDGAP